MERDLKRSSRGSVEQGEWQRYKHMLRDIQLSIDVNKWKCSFDAEKRYARVSLMWVLNRIQFAQMEGDYENNTWLPIKANFLALDFVPTRFSLAKKGVSSASIRCLICQMYNEDINHLFAYCGSAREVWALIGQWMKILIISSSSLESLLDVIQFGFRKGSQQCKMVDSVFKVMIWCLCKAINEKIFKGTYMCPMKILEEIKVKSFLWIKNRGSFKGTPSTQMSTL